MVMAKKWLRRLGYALILVIWLAVMLFPTFAFVLANRGQIQIGSSSQNHVRFFMVQEEMADGVGVEWARPILTNNNCSRTNIVYFLWEGDKDQNTSFCQCTDPATGALLPAGENCTQP